MTRTTSRTARIARWINRYRVLAARRVRPAVAFSGQPEPRTIGVFARGRQLCAGNFLFAGYLVEAPDAGLWDLPMPDHAFEVEVHGFGWLDDLAAVADLSARHRAQDWTHDWVHRYGRGRGPGWEPRLAGRRLTRWINHAVLLLNNQDRATSHAFFRAMSHHTAYLARAWRAAPPGLPRFEALGGLLHASLALQGMERFRSGGLRGLARECAERIGEDGGIPSRNPEELLAILAILTGVVEALMEAGEAAPDEIGAAIREIAPTLRTLRHADGGLARFHGGGRGAEGRLDQALADSGVRHLRHKGLAMGYARLSQGRTTVIVDAAPPPKGIHSLDAHASTNALELSSGRRPVIVSCGSGDTFGATWRRAGRATPSHSTLAIEGYSSSRMGGQGFIAGRRTELLIDTPRNVTAVRADDTANAALILSHDGYASTHGLVHHRRLELAADGRSLIGDDSLAALSPDAEKTFDAAFERTGLRGVPFQIHFHLHPEVHAELDMGGTAVSMALRSGEVWVFRHDGSAHLSLGPSAYLERGRLSPRATKQIVLSAAVMDYAVRIGWTLAKAQDTPTHVRDLVTEETEEPART